MSRTSGEERGVCAPVLAANSTRVTITPVVRVVLRATYSLSCGNVDVRPNTNTKPEGIQIGKIIPWGGVFKLCTFT